LALDAGTTIDVLFNAVLQSFINEKRNATYLIHHKQSMAQSAIFFSAGRQFSGRNGWVAGIELSNPNLAKLAQGPIMPKEMTFQPAKGGWRFANEVFTEAQRAPDTSPIIKIEKSASNRAKKFKRVIFRQNGIGILPDNNPRKTVKFVVIRQTCRRRRLLSGPGNGFFSNPRIRS
jgi:hypothetical protein